MSKYLLSSNNTYRVGTVNEVLALREELEHLEYGELVAFSYTTKQIKQKGEVVEEYQVVKAKIDFNAEKEPELHIDASYGVTF